MLSSSSAQLGAAAMFSSRTCGSVQYVMLAVLPSIARYSARRVAALLHRPERQGGATSMCLAIRSAVAGTNSSVAYSMPPVSSSPSSMLSTRSVCACLAPTCRAPPARSSVCAGLRCHRSLARTPWTRRHRRMFRRHSSAAQRPCGGSRARACVAPHRPVRHFQAGQAHRSIALACAVEGALQGHHRLVDGSVSGAPWHARGLNNARERHIGVLNGVLHHALGALQERQEGG
jgi:hypothetical protein